MSAEKQGRALPATPDRATHEQSPQAVSAVPVCIPSATALVEQIAVFIEEYPRTKPVTHHTGPFDDITSMGRPYRDPGYNFTRDEPVTREQLAEAVRERFHAPPETEADIEAARTPNGGWKRGTPNTPVRETVE